MSENEIPGKHQILFMQLLINFQNVAWQALGKMKNPITDKIERNMDQARYAIDMLEMLRHKTENNVDENEKRFIDSLIRDLQLNYVYEAKKDAEKSQSPAEDEVKTEAKGETGAADSDDKGKAEKPAIKKPATKKPAKKKPAAGKSTKKT